MVVSPVQPPRRWIAKAQATMIASIRLAVPLVSIVVADSIAPIEIGRYHSQRRVIPATDLAVIRSK